MTMYWRWVASSRPKSKTWTMLGCTSRATDSASRRKRATNWSSSARCSASSLTATSRSRRSVEGAHDGRHAADAQALAQLVATREDLAGHHGVVAPPTDVPPVPVSVPVVVPVELGPGRARRRRAGGVPVSVRWSRYRSCRCRWSPCRWSSVSVVRGVGRWVCLRLRLRLAARGGDRLAAGSGCPTAGAGAGSSRRSRAGSSTSFWALITARCAAVQRPARKSDEIWLSALVRLDALLAGIRPSPPHGDEQGGRRRPGRAASERRQRRASSLTVLQALGQRVGQARGADGGRGARRCRTRCAASGRPRRWCRAAARPHARRRRAAGRRCPG